MKTTPKFKIDDLVVCQPDHPDQRVHRVCRVEWCDWALRPYWSVDAYPITAYPEYAKGMSEDGYLPAPPLSQKAKSWMAAQDTLRASAA